MVEVCEGAPVAVSGWVLTDRHDPGPCAASSLHRSTMSVTDVIGGTGTLGMAQASQVTESTMPVLGSTHLLCHAPKEPCTSVASPKRVLSSSLVGLVRRSAQGVTSW